VNGIRVSIEMEGQTSNANFNGHWCLAPENCYFTTVCFKKQDKDVDLQKQLPSFHTVSF